MRKSKHSQSKKNKLSLQESEKALNNLNKSLVLNYSSVKNDQVQAKKTKNEQGTAKRSNLISLFSIIVFIFLIYISLNLSKTAKVVLLSDTGKPIKSNDLTQYSSYIDRQLQSNIWNQNKITINTTAIDQSLTNHFTQLQTASTTISLLTNKLIVYLQFTPATIILNASSGSYILNNQGKVLGTTNNIPNLAALHLPLVTELSNQNVRIGQPALTTNEVNFIETILYELSLKNIAVSSFNLPASSSELDANIVNQPYYVKFNLENPNIRQQVGTYLAVINYLNSHHITATKYIDVRLNGRAYYF